MKRQYRSNQGRNPNKEIETYKLLTLCVKIIVIILIIKFITQL